MMVPGATGNRGGCPALQVEDIEALSSLGSEGSCLDHSFGR